MSELIAEVSHKLLGLIKDNQDAREDLSKKEREIENFIRDILQGDKSWDFLGKSNLVPILFMDIVGYSKIPKDSDQKVAIETLIEIVKQALEEANYELDQVVSLPTGDGMCLCFNTGTDGPLIVAAKVQTLLTRKFKGQKRRIHVRMGIHSGNVLRIRDLKGSYNLAGAAINISQRAMNCGDEGHILCTLDAYKIFKGMEGDYEKRLKPIKQPFTVKHGARLRLYNYFCKDEGFGNYNEPSR
ncbi:MAG TPA: adenylate/guanylate cyclase domain-containing protein [Pyrinomonadaceae bacterium]|jgi:class 3 adenylate cyclase|nr:adenylate/guanylate cyclase domain-containing protein [Pyrinomonadaceae bacterium]